MSKYRIVVRVFLDTTRYCCYGNCATGSKPIFKNFNAVHCELNKVCPYQKLLVNVVN